jgi:hypothetical protein
VRLLQAPVNLPSAVGVLVEEGPGSSFLVKVNCRDRHGLLSDITQALCNLPLQVRLCACAWACCGTCEHAHRHVTVLGPAAVPVGMRIGLSTVLGPAAVPVAMRTGPLPCWGLLWVL